ncbi:MAG: ATP-binding protein [Phycisphaerae bacterium]
MLQALWDTADAGLALLDLEGNLFSINQHFASLLGQDPVQLKGRSILRHVRNCQRTDMLAATQRIATGETESESFSIQLVGQPGQTDQPRPLRISLESICNEAGQVESILLVVWNPRTAPPAKTPLATGSRSLLSTLRGVLESMDNEAYELQPDLTVRWANMVAHTRHGDLFGAPCHVLLESSPKSCANCPARRALQTRQVQVQHRRRPAGPFGQEQYLEVICVPMSASAHTHAGVLLILQDTTPQVRMHHAQRIEAVGRLTGGVAHDFRNQLTVISGYCQLLLRDMQPDDPHRGPVAEILKAADRSAHVTEHLLAFSRQQVLEPKHFDVNQVLASLRNPLTKLIGEDIQFDISPAIRPAVIRADQSLFEQAIVNLALNARDAMPQGGRLQAVVDTTESEPLTVRGASFRGGPCVRISLQDTGMGMPAEVQARALEPFFTTKSKGKGTGLGLSMVASFVHQSDGVIDIQSKPGQGCCIRILLPLSADPSSACEAQPEQDLPCGDETILVVEDEQAVGGLIARVLRKCGYTVLEADHPAKALHMVRQGRSNFDLLITDVVMPGMGGAELAQQIRTTCPHAAILYVSGYPDRIQAETCRIDPENLLPKPFSAESLARRVRQVLDKA